YWRYATRSLLRGGQRSILAIFCVAVGVMAIVALQLVGAAINNGLTGDIQAINGGDLAISTTTVPLTASQLTYFDHLKEQGTITAYTAVDTVTAQARSGGGWRFYQVDAVDPAQFPLAGAPTFTNPVDGSLASLLQDDTVVITSTLAQTLHLSVGDTMRLTTQGTSSTLLTIGGIIQSAGFFRGPLLLINISDYATLAHAVGQQITYDTIYANTPGHTDASATSAARSIQGEFPLATITTTKQALASNQAMVQEARYFLQIVGLLSLLIGGVGIINTLQVLLRRRRVEIAMLKTTGYRQLDLYTLFGLETGLIGLAGGVIGAAAGVGASFLARGFLENSLQASLPITVDPRIVASGVAVGFFTALIFGVLPIVQASQARPLGVLRELPDGATLKGRLFTFALLALLGLLFFALAFSLLQNLTFALYTVGGVAVALGVLSMLFSVVVAVIGRFPVIERYTWLYTTLLLVAVLASAALTVAIPAFGALCLAMTLPGLIIPLLPRPWKANIKLALRNIGRQRARSVATLLALYIGVFSVGLILVLGQNIQNTLQSYLASGVGVNAQVITTNPADKAAVERQLARIKSIRHTVEASFTATIPSAVNGQPIGAFVRTATSSGQYTVSEATGAFTGAQGYDLAHGMAPTTSDIPIKQGRTLTASDAGKLSALLPVAASQAPDNLKLGDTISLTSPVHQTPITLTIIGFYSTLLPQFEPILTDSAVVNALSANHPHYGFALSVDPKTIDSTLAKVQNAVPGAIAFSLSDFVDQYAALLNNLVEALLAITSLATLASVIIIANAVGLAMLERRRELGILKAIGHTSQSVLGETLLENGMIGFTGALLAMLVVALAAAVLGRLAFNLPLGVPTPTVLAVVAATVTVCMLVAAVVAWGATRVRPVETLRYE
ncbi:MAG TPA: FtsX-like permease family protein, partial [Ktedonobacterales bacterium]|nr:FtsX-like permease family protein [Ktedonobacterales bacterium]